MFLLRQILPAAIAGMVMAAILSGLAIFCVKGRARHMLMPFALGGGYFCGHIFVTGWASFPPADTTNWLPYFALFAAAVSSLASLLESRTARGLVLGLLCLAALRLLLEPKFRYGWTAGLGWMWVGGLGLIAVLSAIGWSAMSRRSGSAVELPVLLLIVCGGTSATLMLSGSLLLGQFAVVLAAAVAGTCLPGLLPGCASGEGIAPVFSLLLVALLVSGYFFAELPAISALLLVASPACALLPVGARARLAGLTARVALVSALVAVALILAFRASPALNP